MFDGKRFLPETGTPIWKIERRSTRLAVWLPDPLTVATWMLKSLMTGARWDASAVAALGTVELIRPSCNDEEPAGRQAPVGSTVYRAGLPFVCPRPGPQVRDQQRQHRHRHDADGNQREVVFHDRHLPEPVA